MSGNFLPKVLGLFILMTVAVYLVDSEETITVVTFPTPLEELERIHETCKAKGVGSVQEANEMHRQCLLDAKLIDDEDGVGGGITTAGKLHCDHQPERNSCWKSIVQKIDACIPGRGKTVAKIYSQLVETTCKDEDELKMLRLSSKLCPEQATVSKSCKDHALMTSPDLCKSFKSQKRCEESDLASCQHAEHKALLQKNFKEIGKSLGCESHEDASAGVIKSLTSKLVPLPFIILATKILI